MIWYLYYISLWAGAGPILEAGQPGRCGTVLTQEPWGSSNLTMKSMCGKLSLNTKFNSAFSLVLKKHSTTK